MVIRGHGISLDVPAGWEARIFRRGSAGPVLHAGTFPLHSGDGDFGAAATGRMRSDDRFLALVEYRPDGHLVPGVGLFHAPGPPRRLDPREFGPRRLQVTRAGQLGAQYFFTGAGRACCLYAVVRPAAQPAHRLIAELSAVVATLRLAPA